MSVELEEIFPDGCVCACVRVCLCLHAHKCTECTQKSRAERQKLIFLCPQSIPLLFMAPFTTLLQHLKMTKAKKL